MILPENRQECSCNCLVCKSMCKNTPCLPTPGEAVTLIKSGYKAQLAPTTVIDRFSGLVNNVLAPILTPQGCSFLDQTGNCILHTKGLKPLEGRLAHHSIPNNGLQMYVARKWNTAKAQSLVLLFEIL